MKPSTIPILPSRDFDETSAFYARLGFAEAARYPDEYLIVAHPIGIELHFWPVPELEPQSNHHGCYVRFDSAPEASALYEAWSDADLDAHQLHPPEDPGYNLLEFALLDGDRNLLRIGGVIDPSG